MLDQNAISRFTLPQLQQTEGGDPMSNHYSQVGMGFGIEVTATGPALR